MNRYILIVLMFLVSIDAQATDDVSEKSLVQELLKEVRALRKEVDSLKADRNIKQKELVQEVQTIKKAQIENAQAIEDVNEYTEEVEANSFKDKLDFGLGFKTNLDNFTKKYASGRKVSSNNVWSNKLMLNMKADISDDMNFYGRLSMFKYWGTSNVHKYTYYDNMQGRAPSNSALYVERAYLNWFLFQDSFLPLSFTIGRQPSSDGPSNQFKDNVLRKGTYSGLLYDGAADGIVLTANLSTVLDNPGTYLRLGYAKGYAYNESENDVGNAFIGASNNDIEDTNVFGVFLDTTIPNIDNSLVQISYSRMIDIVANPLDANTTENENIGDVDLYGAMVEFTNFNSSNLDLFAHYGHSVAHPNGKGYRNYGGLLSSNGDTSDKSGDSIWLGSRYGFGKKQRFKVGLEYNHGSENWINLTQGSFDIYNKLATRGDAYEAYLMYVINGYANIRLGYVNVNYDYTGSGWFVGESKKINSSVDNADTTVENLESIYLKMNVNF